MQRSKCAKLLKLKNLDQILFHSMPCKSRESKGLVLFASIILLCTFMLIISLVFNDHLNEENSHLKTRHSMSELRVMCYGDSLTAGYFNGGHTFWPYAKSLKETLEKNGSTEVEIDYYGFCGWTTSQLVDHIDGQDVKDWTRSNGGPGLGTALNQKRYNLTILMAGTNDLGHGRDPNDIFSNLEKLIEASLSVDVPVLVIGIPDSAYLARDSEARKRRDQVNQMLIQKASNRTNLTYTDCPFNFESRSKYFDRDGLHFSKEGYKTLGSSLAPTIVNILHNEHAAIK